MTDKALMWALAIVFVAMSAVLFAAATNPAYMPAPDAGSIVPAGVTIETAPETAESDSANADAPADGAAEGSEPAANDAAAADGDAEEGSQSPDAQDGEG